MIGRHAIPLLLAAVLASLDGRVEAQSPAGLESQKDQLLEQLPAPVGDPESLFARKRSVQELLNRLKESNIDPEQLMKLRQDPKSLEEYKRTGKISGIPDDIIATIRRWTPEEEKQNLRELENLRGQQQAGAGMSQAGPSLGPVDRNRRPIQAVAPQTSGAGSET